MNREEELLKKMIELSLKEARSFESSSSLLRLDEIGTQQPDVNDPLLDDLMAIDKLELERVNREVIVTEKKARQKARTERAQEVKKEKMDENQRKLIGEVQKRKSVKLNAKDRLGVKGKKSGK